MIYCNTCKELFSEEDAHKTKNYVPYGDTHVLESTSYECPYCGSSNLDYDVQVVECDRCGELIPSCESQNVDGFTLCEDCAED